LSIGKRDSFPQYYVMRIKIALLSHNASCDALQSRKEAKSVGGKFWPMKCRMNVQGCLVWLTQEPALDLLVEFMVLNATTQERTRMHVLNFIWSKVRKFVWNLKLSHACKINLELIVTISWDTNIEWHSLRFHVSRFLSVQPCNPWPSKDWKKVGKYKEKEGRGGVARNEMDAF